MYLAFNDNDGKLDTQRIAQTDVKTTLQWLENMVDLDLIDNINNDQEHSLHKLELTVDSNKISPDQLMAELRQWCDSHDLNSREYIKNSGSKIYFKTPINGNSAKGFIQTDFNFVKNPNPQTESDVNFLSRLRDRIVNQGMLKLIESDEPVIHGGRSRVIDHIEDLIFRKGTRGIGDALTHIRQLAKDAPNTATVKWDGTPAIIFGRDTEGAFVLTDVSGYNAKNHNGLFSNPTHSTDYSSVDNSKDIRTRKEQLAPVYDMLWPMLEQAVPQKFRGFIHGDLLYTERPTEDTGSFIFQPNTVQYNIPAISELGVKIANSTVGIAIHTYYKDHDANKEPIKNIKFNSVPGLLLITPIRPSENVISTDRTLVKQLRNIMSVHSDDIDTLFNPSELKQMQISDLPRLCIQFVNSIVQNEYEHGFNVDTLISTFGDWLKDTVTPRKYRNIVEYLQSPRSNLDGMGAVFAAFVLLHDIKMDLLQQLDRQQPGHEGWVVASPGGISKLVDRFKFFRNNQSNRL